MANELLNIDNLKVAFPLDAGDVHAVRGVTMSIKQGEIVGLVGESGCGKSVTAQSILRIVPPPGILTEGNMFFQEGETASNRVDLAEVDPRGKKIRSIRGNRIAMIFQEPSGSLAPIYTVGDQIMEAILLHKDLKKQAAREITINLLEKVGIPDPENSIDRYPFEFSGGMRQRAMIAMALSCQPALLIADEPTTALDATIQAQILKLMLDLQREYNMAILFITHNLGVVAQIADQVAIMYLGKIVEKAGVREIFYKPKHPYTKGLLKAIPRIQPNTEDGLLYFIKGKVPGPFERVCGCPFHPRCESFIPGVCDQNIPTTTHLENGHTVSCFLYE